MSEYQDLLQFPEIGRLHHLAQEQERLEGQLVRYGLDQDQISFIGKKIFDWAVELDERIADLSKHRQIVMYRADDVFDFASRNLDLYLQKSNLRAIDIGHLLEKIESFVNEILEQLPDPGVKD